MGKTLSVAAIKDGMVIDHIPAGNALAIIELLKLNTTRDRILLGLNLPSKSMHLKDILKIENRFLSEKELEQIAVFAPQACINTIKNYRVTRKLRTQPPKKVVGLLSCPNPRCITHTEPLPSDFCVETFKETIVLRCSFCDKLFERKTLRC